MTDHIARLSPMQTYAGFIGERLHAAIIAGNHGIPTKNYEDDARKHLAELAHMMGYTIAPIAAPVLEQAQ